MKPNWTPIPSWTVGVAGVAPFDFVIRDSHGCPARDDVGELRRFNSRAAALAAANKQNRLEGLPEVQ